jgi:hypothetical protein
MHAQQRRDVEGEYFVERIFEFPFATLAPGASQSVNLRIMSMGGPYVVMVAMRGTLEFSNRALTGLELGFLRLRLVLNGLDDWISDGGSGNEASMAALFSGSPAPWLWLSKPTRLRAGDNLIATIRNAGISFETAPTLRPQLLVRLADEQAYWTLYGKHVDIDQAADAPAESA